MVTHALARKWLNSSPTTPRIAPCISLVRNRALPPLPHSSAVCHSCPWPIQVAQCTLLENRTGLERGCSHFWGGVCGKKSRGQEGNFFLVTPQSSHNFLLWFNARRDLQGTLHRQQAPDRSCPDETDLRQGKTEVYAQTRS